MRDEFLSEEDLDLKSLSEAELLAYWDLWLHQAQASNAMDEHVYTHGVFMLVAALPLPPDHRPSQNAPPGKASPPRSPDRSPPGRLAPAGPVVQVRREERPTVSGELEIPEADASYPSSGLLVLRGMIVGIRAGVERQPHLDAPPKTVAPVGVTFFLESPERNLPG